MTRGDAIADAFVPAEDGDEDFTIFIHRDYPGEHDENSEACWCKPFAVSCYDPRTPEEVLRDVEAAEAAEVAQ